MQDWSSKYWTRKDKQVLFVEQMNMQEVLEAIWAMYILTLKNPKFLGVPYSVLGNAVYSRMRTLVSELEFERTRQATNARVSTSNARIKD